MEELRKSKAHTGTGVGGTSHVAAARLPVALPYEASLPTKVPRLHGSYLCRCLADVVLLVHVPHCDDYLTSSLFHTSLQGKGSIFIMNSIISLLALSAVATASVVQHPLNDGFGSQAPLSSKPLVSSEALERHITPKNLLKRAKKLFEIAELGAAEYNHPTRVIGSSGKHQTLTVPSVPSANETVVQDMLEP